MENSLIEWTTHTFNPWWGCMKVSEGCKNCYAAALDNRWNGNDPHWGPNSERKPMSEEYWKKLAKWNTAAKLGGRVDKVFVASMADWAESNETLKHYPSQLMVHDARLRLFQAIAIYKNLNFLMLTKRIDNVMPIIESLHAPLFRHDTFEDGNKEYLADYREAYYLLTNWLNGNPPENVWIGTSVENQDAADERIPELLKIPAKVRFLSCEPLLGPVDLTDIWVNCPDCYGSASIPVEGGGVPCGRCLNPYQGKVSGIQWLICGGESGHGARPMHPDWARSLRDECKRSGISFFFKQWGEYLPACQSNFEQQIRPVGFPSPNNPGKTNTYYKLGKEGAGAVLDGREWKDFPPC